MLTIYLPHTYLIFFADHLPSQFYITCLSVSFCAIYIYISFLQADQLTYQSYSTLLPNYYADCLHTDFILCQLPMLYYLPTNKYTLCWPGTYQFYPMLTIFLPVPLTRIIRVTASQAPAGHAHLEIPACGIIPPYQRASWVTLEIIPAGNTSKVSK